MASRSDKAYWRRLANAWTHAEGVSVPGQSWRELFTSTRPGREYLMEADVRELVAGLPERCASGAALSVASTRTAFRGRSPERPRSPGRTGVVIQGTVAREDVIALFVERLEMEIVAVPECVTVESVEDVGDETPRMGGQAAYVIEPA
jgi:hypothetical protein